MAGYNYKKISDWAQLESWKIRLPQDSEVLSKFRTPPSLPNRTVCPATVTPFTRRVNVTKLLAV